MDPEGNHIGYMAERDSGLRNMMTRQWFRTHRSFITHVFDKNELEVLRVSSAITLQALVSFTHRYTVSPAVLLDLLSHPCIRSMATDLRQE